MNIGIEKKSLLELYSEGKTDFTLEELTTALEIGSNKQYEGVRHIPLAVCMIALGHTFDESTEHGLSVLRVPHKKYTVAHVQANFGYIFKTEAALRLEGADDGWTVAHVMADKGHVFTDSNILSIADKQLGETVAHTMAKDGYKFEDMDTLKLADKSGFTVAHEMAARGHIFDEPDILLLRSDVGETVMDTTVKHGYVFPDDHYVMKIPVVAARLKKGRKDYLRNNTITPIEIAKNKQLLSDFKEGGKVDFTLDELWAPVAKTQFIGIYRPLAHEMVNNFHVFPLDHPALAVRSTVADQTTAHFMAAMGHVFPEDHECLGWKRKSGATVAHVMAEMGYRFPDDSPIVFYRNNKTGTYVAHYMALKGHVFDNNHPCMNLKDFDGVTVRSLTKTHGR